MNMRCSPPLVVAVSLLVHGAAHAQWLNYPTSGIPRLPNGQADLAAAVPHTADGRPDLSGIWRRIGAIADLRDLTGTLRPEEVLMTPWASAVQAPREGRDSRSLRSARR